MRHGRVVFGWLVTVAVMVGLAFALLKTLPPQKVPSPADTTETPFEQPDSGLQTFVETIAAQKGDYAIAVAEPGGHRASANGDKPYVAASAYKLFIAYGVFQQIHSGAMQWSDPAVGGQTVEQCFEAMMVQSENDCAVAFGDRIGWQQVDAMMDGIGLRGTEVRYVDTITTANDLALFLAKLHEGTLLGDADSQRLLDAMKRQVHRLGIPAGTGVETANKPGFLDGLLHDAAIVYGSKSTYIMVILSGNSSWSELADAAKQVHNYLQQ